MADTASGKKYTTIAIVLYHVVTFLEGFNLQCTPVCMRAFEMSLGLTASRLSVVFATELLSLLGIAAVWGYLVGKKQVKYICSLGMLLCGIACILIGCTSGFPLVLVCRFLHGAGLSCVGPVYSKIITEHYGKKEQGGGNGNDQTSTWFSVANGAHCAGKVLSLMLVSVLATRNVVGQYGWRLCYCITGYVWLMVAVVVFFFMKGGSTESSGTGELKFHTKPTFWVMACVMFFSEAPYVIMGYMVMYLQYSGLSTVMIGSAIIVMQMGTAIGSVAGGFIAEVFHELCSKYGKLSLAACVLLMRVVFLVQFLWWPLNEHGLVWHQYCILFIIGFTLFVSPTVEKPIVSEISESSESIAVPLYRAIGGMPSYIVFMPLLGFIAEKMYGYVKPSGDVSQLGHVVMSVNANALRRSMIWILSIATVVNISLYVVVYYAEELGKALKALSCSATTTPTPTTTTSSSSNEITYHWYAKVLFFIPPFIQGVNMEIPPICMHAFEITLGLSPSRLSWIPSVQFMFFLGVSPLWGLLLDMLKLNVAYVQCIAICICGISSILMAYVSHYPLVLLLTLLNSCGNAATIPVSSKMIGEDKVMKGQQTLWFGVYWSIYYVGALVSDNITVILSMKNIAGVYGWRVCYCLGGYLWLVIAAPIFFWMTSDDQQGKSSSGNKVSPKEILCIMRKPTFWLTGLIIYTSFVALGLMAYLTMYLQNSGLSDSRAGFAASVVMMGVTFGSATGGFMTDEVHKLNGCYGKLSVGAVAVFIRVVLMVSFLWTPITGGRLQWYHYICLFVYGTTFVTLNAIDTSVASDIAPSSAESLSVSLLEAIGGIPSYATITPMIGYLCEKKFGYVMSTETGDPLPPEVMANNVSALRKSMLIVFVLCSVINIALYVVALATYRGDKAKKGDKETACPAPSGTGKSSCGGSRDVSQESASQGVDYKWYAKVLCFVPAFVQGVNIQLLQTCMHAFEITLGFSPSRLSWIPSAQIMFFLGVSPLWSLLLDKFKKKVGDVQCIATCICGISCILMSYVSHYPLVMLFTVLNGCGNAACIAVAPKMINEDKYMTGKPTLWFGVNWSVYCVGALISAYITVSLSMKNIGGMYGWRVCHCIVGYLWLALAAPIFYWMKKPDGTGGGGGGGANSTVTLQQIQCIMQRTTFWLMVCVGYTSQAAFAVLVYLTMYLQSSGVPGMSIGFAFTVVMIGNLAGGFSGGFMTDHIHAKVPFYGKLSVGAVTVFIRVLAVLGFLWSPIPGGTFRWYHHIYLFVYGITFFTIKAVDISISADLAQVSAKSLTIGLVSAIGGVASNATVVPAVGYLCEKKFGYVTSTETGDPLPPEVMANNVSALRKSMLIVFVVCSIINIALYLVALATYGHDKDKTCPEAAASTGTGKSSCPYISKPKPYPWYAVLLYHIAEFMEGYNMQCTPVCMRALEMSFGVSASKLSFMYAVDLVSVLGIGAVWGYLLDTPLGKQKKKMEVQHVCCLGALVCGMGSILLGCTSSYPLILCSRFLQGGGLACVTQVCTKIIIEQWSVPPTEIQNCPKQASQTSLWFGLGFGVHCLGRVASLFLVGRIATWNVIGQYGWRLNYVLAGYVWLLLSVPVHCLMKKTITGAQHGSSSVDGAQFDPTNSSGRGEPQTAAVTVISSTSMTSTNATSSISISNAQGGVVGTSAPSTTPSTTKSESGGPENGTAAENGASVPSASTPLPQTAAPPEKNGEKPELATLLSNLIFCDGECFWSWNCSWLKKIGEWLRGTQKLVAVSLSGLTNLWHSIKKWLPFGGDASGGNNNQSTETSGAPSESVEVAPQPQTATSSGQGLSNGKEKRRQAMAKKTVEEAKKQLTEMCRSTGLSDFLCNHWWKSGVKLWSARSPKKKRQRRTTNGNSGKDGVPNEEGAMTQSTSTSEASGAASRSNGESATLQRQTYTSTTTTTTSSINFGSNGLGEQKKVEMTKTTKETPVEKGITSEGTHGFIHGSTISCTSNSSSNNGTAQPSCKGVYTYRSIPLNTLNDSESAKVSKLTPIPFYEKATFWLMKNSNVAYIIRVQHSINAMVSLNGHIWVYINCSVNTFNDVPLSLPLFRVILLYDYQMRSTH